MPYVYTNGIRLSYERHGRGERVLLIMGQAAAGRLWTLHQTPALVRAGYQAITLDNRGIPPSDVPPGKYSIADMVADTKGVIEALDAAPCRIVGASLGAMIAQELAIGWPHLVRCAVLMSTKSRSDRARAAIERAERAVLRSGAALPGDYQSVMTVLQLLSPATLNNDAEVTLWLETFRLAAGNDTARGQAWIETGADRRAALREVTVPCRVIAFADDLITPPHLGMEVADAIPDCDFVEIGGCAHSGYLERPDAVNEAIIEFLDKNLPTGRAMADISGVNVPNLADPRTFATHDMDKLWRELRAQNPVHWHPESSYGPGFWVVSRYADVLNVLHDDITFTSEQGNVLATMLHGGDSAGGRMLAVSDGEYHTELRKLLLKAFAPRVLEPVVRRVRQTARRLLAEGIERGGCDFARDIASVLPLETICDLLDVPADDRQYVFKLTKSALSLDYESQSGENPAARREILVYFSSLVTARRKSLGSDPISLMATGEVGGKQLDDITIILNCYSLIMGGDGTNRLAIIGAVKALIENQDQWAALKNGEVTPESACEEVLRWTTPTMHFGRTAVADTALAGKRIAAGDLVTLWFSSANRDETVFPEPGRFDLGRSPNKHVSLGYARHFCLGGYLGRAEITAMLDALRVSAVEMEQMEPERYIYSNFLQGMSSLRVSLKGDPATLAAAGD